MQSFKFLDDQGKVFSDLKSDTEYSRSSNYKYETETYTNSEEFEAKYKAFVKDGKKGLVSESKSKTDRNGEKEEQAHSERLVNFEEGFKLSDGYSHIGQITTFDGIYVSGLSLGYFGEYVTDYLNYKKNGDFYSPFNGAEELYDTEFKVKEYSFELRADETKLYMSVSRKLNYKMSDGSARDWNTRIVLYLDVRSNLTADYFTENYITDENAQDLIYYTFDSDKAAKDIKEGKEVVINPSGSAATGMDGFWSPNSPTMSSEMRAVFYKDGAIANLCSLPVQLRTE